MRGSQPPVAAVYLVTSGVICAPAGFVGDQISAVEGRQLLEAMNPNPRRAGPVSARNEFMGGEVSAAVPPQSRERLACRTC